jgi:uncharacterized protein (TIGR02147 family)
MPDIFKYTHVPTYLIAVYAEMNQRAIYSYRTIANHFDINLSIVHGIFNGQRKITPRHIKKFIDILELKGEEKEYFQMMVKVSLIDISKKFREKILDSLNPKKSSKEEKILQSAYVAWKQGPTKGMAWRGLKKAFLEYERVRPDKRVKI